MNSIIVSTGCTTCGKSLLAKRFVDYKKNENFIRIERDPVYRKLILYCLKQKNFDIYMEVFSILKEKLIFFTTYSDALNKAPQKLFMPYEINLILSSGIDFKKLFYIKDEILMLRKIFQRYDEYIRKLATYRCIFEAIKEYYRGRTVIMDAVFYPGEFARFPIKPLILLNYVPMDLLKKRIKRRNKNAEDNGLWYNYRPVATLRTQFSKIFSPIKTLNTFPLEFLDISEAAKCFHNLNTNLKKIPIYSTYKYDVCLKINYEI